MNPRARFAEVSTPARSRRGGAISSVLALVIAALSTSTDARGEPPLATTIADDPAPIAAPLARVLQDLDATYTPRTSRERPPREPSVSMGAQIFRAPDGTPEAIFPGIGFSWDLDPHPERFFTDRRFTLRVLPAAEIALMLGYGFRDYWINKDVNSLDWELSWSGTSFRKKLWTFEAVRFDTNKYETNTVAHPATGLVTYLAARGSGLGVGEAYVYALGGSIVWEVLGEYREKVSLNDLIFTPWGGPTIGEPLHQLGLFFERGADNIVNQTLSFAASPFRFVHRHVGRWFVTRAKSLDDLGFPADVWHRFDLLFGVSAQTGKDGLRLSDRRVGVSTEIIDVAEYDHPGEVLRSLPAGAVTSIRLVGSFDDRGLHQFDFVTRLLLGGVYEQDITRDARGGLSGHAIFIGPSTAFNYATHYYERGQPIDKIASTHVLGITIDGTLYRGKTRARLGADVYGDFSAVHSFAIDEWRKTNETQGIKNVVAEKDYYFAGGITLRPTLSIVHRRLELGAQLQEDFFESIEGIDRYQERVTNDFHLSDRRSGQRVWLSYTLPGDRLRLTWIELERLYRSGSIGVVRVAREATDVRVGFSLRF